MKDIKLGIIGLAISVVGGLGIIIWYDWKLLLALFLLMWGNNIDQANHK